MLFAEIKPKISLIPVPEFPKSIFLAEIVRQVAIRELYIYFFLIIFAPNSFITLSVFMTSSPSEDL